VDASLAAGSLGRSAAAVTDSDLTAEIYSYARTRGIFAGIALQGASLDVDGDALDAYYGKPGLTAQDVIGGAGLPTPADAARLMKALGVYQKSLR
jgi:lipid-binding SYLF domain-containing protein